MNAYRLRMKHGLAVQFKATYKIGNEIIYNDLIYIEDCDPVADTLLIFSNKILQENEGTNRNNPLITINGIDVIDDDFRIK
ncbi:MAG: hypothetical protein NTV01_20640 [Bacteroidia bacterium]|nr:hypothetical protein [Bacteroidia bacterium]